MSFFKKATRKRVFLKLAIMGPSGSGKTYSALRLAFGLAPTGKVAVIDTENDSASLYADMRGKDGIGEFDAGSLEAPFTPERYIEAIRAAEAAGYEVLVIDSITHEWRGKGGILDAKEKLDARGGNSYANWGQLTPRHNAFVAAILESKLHVICTLRSKQDYVIDQQNGKSTPRKVGLAAEQRDGMEYEFTVVFDCAMDHNSVASKDRTGLFQGFNDRITPEQGKWLLKWLEGGAEELPDPDAERAKAEIEAARRGEDSQRGGASGKGGPTPKPAAAPRKPAAPAQKPAQNPNPSQGATLDAGTVGKLAALHSEASRLKAGKAFREAMMQLTGEKSFNLPSLPATLKLDGQELPVLEAAERVLRRLTEAQGESASA